jgi:hypothetical protein
VFHIGVLFQKLDHSLFRQFWLFQRSFSTLCENGV